MPADQLREKLKALVELWREEDLNSKACSPASVRVERRYQLAALLAESEPCTVQECKTIYICMVGPYREERPFAAFSSEEKARKWLEMRQWIPHPRYPNSFVPSSQSSDRYVEAYIEECDFD